MTTAQTDTLIDEIDAAAQKLQAAKADIGQTIFGQEDIIDQTIITLLSGGHALLVGLPGLAKTKLVETIGTTFGLDEARIQFTPDLMPSDILGSEVMEQDDEGKRRFKFLQGPIFTQLLMADEINRASPRTQSALLQAMQEYHVTIAGKPYQLPSPFHVLATQNPLEQEGTYPLPEAQLDRFLLQINVDYPDRDAERQMLLETTGTEEATPKQAITAQELQSYQALLRTMPVSEDVMEGILTLVRSARPSENKSDTTKHITWGPGPRASQALMLTTRARALLDGRLAPSLDDVLALAEPVLQHRMALSYTAQSEGITVKDVITQLKAQLA